MNKIKKIHSNNPFLARGSLLVSAAAFASFLNFLYNAYLGRAISVEDFAVISLYGSIFSIFDIFIGSLGKTITYKSAYILGRFGVPAATFWKKLRRKSFVISTIVSLLWVSASPFFASYFKIDEFLPVIAFAPVWIFSILATIDGGFLGGNLFLGYLAFVSVIEAMTKLAAAFVISKSGFGEYAYFAIVISTFTSFILLMLGAKRIRLKSEKVKKEIQKFPLKFYYSNIITRLAIIVYLSFDVILAKHYLSATQAGEYALLSLSGKIIFTAGSFFAQFITPLVSHSEGKGKGAIVVFHKLLLATFVASFVSFIAVGALSRITMPILFGSHANPIINIVPLYALAMAAFTLASSIVTFHQIKNRHFLPSLSFIFAVAQVFLISLFHKDMQQIAYVMILLGFANLAVMGILHLIYPRIETALRNFNDFFDLLLPVNVPDNVKGLKILIFNWRDTKHTWAGGAEVYVHELAKQWVKNGNYVTLFCGNDGLCNREEKVDGVRVIRRGGFYTVYIWAALYYVFKFRKNFDVIVDSENGIPFFSPLFSTKPVVLLIHHVHQEIFREHLITPFSQIAQFIEGKFMPFIYKNKSIVTVSESSRQEIIKNGIALKPNINVINPGITLSKRKIKKTNYPSIIYLGRLKPYKNIDVAIRAFTPISQKYQKAKLLIVGDGESRQYLEKITEELGLNNKVLFLGKVGNVRKRNLLASSWVAVQPSQLEGWGITVLEANANGTTVIASRTLGLKDSIVDKKTGILVEVQNVNGFSNAMEMLIKNAHKRNVMSLNSYEWAKQFKWEDIALKFYDVIENELTNKRRLFLPRASYFYNRITSLF